MNLEKILSEAGIHLLDSENKQSLFIITIVFEIYKASYDNTELHNQAEKYLIKMLKSINQ